MIFLILISNIYNTTPNKQILISFFEKIKKKSDEQEAIADDRKTNLEHSPERVFSEQPKEEDMVRSRIMESESGESFEQEPSNTITDELAHEVDQRCKL